MLRTYVIAGTGLALLCAFSSTSAAQAVGEAGSAPSAIQAPRDLPPPPPGPPTQAPRPEAASAAQTRPEVNRLVDLAKQYLVEGRLIEAEQMLGRALLLVQQQRVEEARADDSRPPLRVGGDIRAPAKVRHVDPVYPAEAKQAGLQGVVILEAVIGTDGLVEDVRLLRGRAPELDQAAMDAVRQWAFTPTLLNGEPVRVIMTMTTSFTLR